MGIDPAQLARAIRRNRRRCIALDLELLQLLRALDLWRSRNPGSAVELADLVALEHGRRAARSIGHGLEQDALTLELEHGLPPQDGPPPAPPGPRSRAHENLEGLKRRSQRA